VSARRQIARSKSGCLLLCERAEALPLVHVSISLSRGSATDPEDARGLTRLMARMLRMGTRQLKAPDVEDRLDSMGAQLSIGVGPGYVHFSAVVVERNVEPLFALLGQLLGEPALRKADLARLKRETRAGIAAGYDDDSVLCGRHFRSFILPDHAYGRSPVGTARGIGAVDVDALRQQHARLLTGPSTVVAAAGRLDTGRLQQLVDTHLGWLPRRAAVADPVGDPSMPRGRRVLIVDKPDRTQAQLLVGTLGTRARDRDHTALLVADTAFGGLFTSRLTNEVRAKRGYSYGANSGFGQQRQRDLWSMRTAPASGDAINCLTLQLSLYDEYVQEGLRAKELSVARDYLRKGVAFHSDTAAKRVDQRIDVELFGLPRDYHGGFAERVRAVTRSDANAAVARRMSQRDLSIVLVATASEVRPKLEQLPGIASVEVVPFDSPA